MIFLIRINEGLNNHQIKNNIMDGSMDEEEMIKRLEVGSQIVRYAGSRIPESGPLEMNINDYIATLTRLLEASCHIGKVDIATGFSTPAEESASLGYKQKTIDMFTYLRDNTNAKTVGDAMQTIRERKIDPIIVGVWVDEGMCVNWMEYNAVAEGYPEYSSKLKEISDKLWSEL